MIQSTQQTTLSTNRAFRCAGNLSIVFALFFLFLFFFLLALSSTTHAVSCGGTCIAAADVSSASGKCLFIYNGKVYEPPASSISGGMHKGVHMCGADVTGIMAQTHLNNPGSYLTPYVCAPLCAAQAVCADADGDGSGAKSCGGTDCNDANPAVHPGATEICNGIDDNCDGQVDEGLSQKSVTCGIGACQVTISQSCTGGKPDPVCTPKSSVSEICGNSIDDDCNGQIDDGCACTPGKTMLCGASGGICRQGLQTCKSNMQWGPCVGDTPALSGEICGNGLDDDCNGQVDDGCPTGNGSIYEYYSQPPLPPAPQFNAKPDVCVPLCVEHCGQTNGCGGNCPSENKYAAGKCGNSVCEPSCADHCGQGDGCGGVCDNSSLSACGACGNPPCCIATELCGNVIDDNCDGRVDEQCSIFMRLLGRAPPQADISGPPGIIDRIGMGVALIEKLSLIVRASGLIAFFFAGLTLLIGIFRFELIKKFTRAEVIKYHALVGFFSLFFLAVHIVGAVTDVPGWGDTVHWTSALFPSFSGETAIQSNVLTGVAWGVIGMYLLLITILTGIFFLKMARKIGYKTWLFLHRLSFAFYAFIFYHALSIGSDFGNWYVRVFFGHVILIIFVFVLVKTYRNKKVMDNVRSLAAKIGLHAQSVTVEDIIFNPDYVGQRVTTHGITARVPLQNDVVDEWWLIHGENHSLFALMPADAKPDEYMQITGTVRKVGPHLYLEVSKLKQQQTQVN